MLQYFVNEFKDLTTKKENEANECITMMNFGNAMDTSRAEEENFYITFIFD